MKEIECGNRTSCNLVHCTTVAGRKMFYFITMALTVSIIGMATIIMAARSYKFCRISRIKEHETSLSSMCKAAIPHISMGKHIHTRLPHHFVTY